ncbi:hypothetical protein GVY41_13635 [Frigidibacter albus]|uniref:Uncharacterized protein n=1 Tax=Frigidibacter albus TaxID=1465486 RepID=A0A6L8VL88_9RHOB|nr:hypothetical protein [Frigidibacter albus]MZQ90129.1 hypothetical protein [Frigidibacter albus]NBE32037.1 hypothetical protein [Frigidibacter albus]GGH57229.1 hypothetical protein GCM10011341_26450 [Frigidibacter albus]
MADTKRIVETIETSDDPAQLRRFMANARQKKAAELYDLAFRRLLEVLPDPAPGTVEGDMWRSVHALEQVLTEERGKAARLTRTRAKLTKGGAIPVLRDFDANPELEGGFALLIARKLAEFTGEAVVLRHAASFAAEVVSAARDRLEEAGVETEAMGAA